jgi:hypothetical protein
MSTSLKYIVQLKPLVQNIYTILSLIFLNEAKNNVQLIGQKVEFKNAFSPIQTILVSFL